MKSWRGLLGLILLVSAGWAKEDNFCVTCHTTVDGVSYMEHNFADWEKSVHAKAGVLCQACHGGDPTKQDKPSAHAGIRPSTDPKSSVYFTRVQDTCGACHQAELKSFKKSSHYKELQRSGRGPNCVTCHGSMANHVLAPRDLEMTCTLCHRRPTQAYATLMALNNARASLDKLKGALQTGRADQGTALPQEVEYQEALKLYGGALTDWHTFKMEAVLRAAQEVTRRATNALNEFQIKRMQKNGQNLP